MPNGGPTPDCIHCEKYRGKPFTEDEPHCTYHNMNLASKIYVFCSMYVDPEPDKNGDWLDQMLGNREQLDNNMMYAWLGGYEIKFFHVPLAPISEYANWTEEIYFGALQKLVEKHQDRLRR